MSDCLANLRQKIHACSATNEFKMLELYQDYLARKLNAFQVTWYAGYRGQFGRKLWHTEVMYDWKIFDIKFPIGTSFDKVDAAKKYYLKARSTGALDPQVKISVENAGKSRVHLLHDNISKEDWDKHWMKVMLGKYDIGERMAGVFSMTDIAESYFLVDRGFNEEPFNESDRQSFLDALISFPRLHYWLFLNRGLIEPATRPLSPREKEVLQLVLGPKTEAEIADQLELSKGTVHNYIVDIYKNFGVSSRYELTQLWLAEIPHKANN